jgi:hypothetical protein
MSDEPDFLHDPVSPQRLEPLDEWRARMAKHREEASADYARRHPEEGSEEARAYAAKQYGPVIKALARILAREINAVEIRMRREIQIAMLPRRRRKKLTPAEIEKEALMKKVLARRPDLQPKPPKGVKP